MSYQSIFAAVFISQILVFSFYWPRKLVRLGREDAFREWRADRHGDGRADASKSRRRKSFGGYQFLNIIIAFIGITLLAVILGQDIVVEMKPTLLAVGVFFFLQLSPLVLPNLQKLRAFLKDAKTGGPDDEADGTRPARLFDFTSPVAVIIAAALYFAYVGFVASEWTGESNTQLAKLLILTASNIILIVLAAKNLFALKYAAPEDAAKRYRTLTAIVPMFVGISIMLSVYYFGKELLFGADMGQLRPVMMSLFLQVLGVLCINALFPGVGRRRARG